MGYVFDVDDITFWSPSQNVGKALTAEIAALEKVIGIDSGVVETMSDTVEVDLAKLQSFASRMVESNCWNNFVFTKLLGGLQEVLIAMLIAHSVSPESLLQKIDPNVLDNAKTIAATEMKIERG